MFNKLGIEKTHLRKRTKRVNCWWYALSPQFSNVMFIFQVNRRLILFGMLSWWRRLSQTQSRLKHRQK